MFDVEVWRTINIIFVALGQTLFVLLYVTFPWWRSFLGRALFIEATTFCLLVDVAVAGRVWDWPGEDAIFVLLYGIVGLGVWIRLYAFVKVTLTSKRSDWERSDRKVSRNDE